MFRLCIEAWDSIDQVCLNKASCTVTGDRLTGNVALVSHPGVPKPESKQTPANDWFKDWRLSGDRVTHHASDTCSPILCTQYTLSQGITKMTAQLMPIDDSEPQHVQLQVKRLGTWKTLAREQLILPGWTATFRVPQWKSDVDVPYRVTWNGHSWGGTIRKDPVDKSTIVVAGFMDNYGRKAHGYLSSLIIRGTTDPVVQVINEETDEIVYTLRIKGAEFRPKVFKDSVYTVRVIDPENNKAVKVKGLRAEPTDQITTLEIGL